MRRPRPRVWLAGLVALIAAMAGSMWVLAAPAFPTTYAVSPVPYSTDAVARGASRFAQDCAGCHGPEGRGDGPIAATLPKRPANLVEHASHHPPGNLYWWIAHGLPGTPMPAFSPKLPDDEIWSLVDLLAARSAADAAMSIGERVADARVRMPDFAYELADQGQRTLLGERTPALVVLYTLPASLARLQALASDHALAHGTLRVIAVALAPADARSDEGPLRARTSANVAAVYAPFARTRGRPPPAHAELLVDADGFLRARWLDVPGSDAKRNEAITTAARQSTTRPAVPAAPVHRHGG